MEKRNDKHESESLASDQLDVVSRVGERFKIAAHEQQQKNNIWTAEARAKHHKLMHNQILGHVQYSNPYHSNPSKRDEQDEELVMLKVLSRMGREAQEVLANLNRGEEVRKDGMDLIRDAVESIDKSQDIYTKFLEKGYSFMEAASEEIRSMRSFLSILTSVMTLAYALNISEEALDDDFKQISATHDKRILKGINKARKSCQLPPIPRVSTNKPGAIVEAADSERQKLTVAGDLHDIAAERAVIEDQLEINHLLRLSTLRKIALHPIFYKSGKEDTSVTLEVPFQKVVKNSDTFDTSVGVCFQDRPNKMKLMIDGWIRWPKNKVKYAFDKDGEPCSVDSDGYSSCRKHGFELDRPEHENKLLIERVDYDKLMENYARLSENSKPRINPYEKNRRRMVNKRSHQRSGREDQKRANVRKT